MTCSANAGSDTSPRDRGRHAPTARSSGSIEPWHASGPTASAIPPIDTAPQHCHTGSTTTTSADHTAQSETGPQSAAFTTSVGRTTSDYTRTWSPSGEIEYATLADGTRLRYVKAGSGPALILLHTVRTQLDHFQFVI